MTRCLHGADRATCPRCPRPLASPDAVGESAPRRASGPICVPTVSVVRPVLSEEDVRAVGRLLVALAVQKAPGREAEALAAAVGYWLDEELIPDTDPEAVRELDAIAAALARLDVRMKRGGGVPGRTRGQGAPTLPRFTILDGEGR